MKKRVFAVLTALSIVFSTCMVSANVIDSVEKNTRTPESFSINGELKDGTSIYAKPDGRSIISPFIFLGYEYVPKKESLANKKIDYTYGYIYATSVEFGSGVYPKYTLTVTRSTTKSTGWDVSASASGGFNISAIKANLQANSGYSSKKTVTIKKDESWETNFKTPGKYELTWYMRAHMYDAFCGSKIKSTGSDDGVYKDYYLGTVSFPTDEIHFDVRKVK